MAYIKIWVHIVWTTKNSQPFLTKEIRDQVFPHIRENARSKGICIDFINGYLEHVHCLVSLKADQCIDKILMLIKGESSRWINKQKLLECHFSWQKEYFAVSVSESGLNRVREYIRNQEEHHRKKTFAEEYQKFLDYYGFEKADQGLKPLEKK